MPRYLNILFRSRTGPAPGDHPGPEDLACLAQGRLEEERRGSVIAHVLECDQCYEVVEGALAELEKDAVSTRSKARIFQWPGLAVAASILTALVGVGVYYHLPEQGTDGGPPFLLRQPMVTAESPKQARKPVAAIPELKASKMEKGLRARVSRDLEIAEEEEASEAPAVQASPPAASEKAAAGKVTSTRETAGAVPAGQASAPALTRARPPIPAPQEPPGRVTLHLRIDPDLMALLRENDHRVWTDPGGMDRLRGIIQEMGAEEVIISGVSWAGPFSERLLRDPAPESLMITIEKGEALLRLAGE